MAQTRLRSLGEGDTDQLYQPGPIEEGTPTGPLSRQGTPVEHAATSILFASLKALSHRAVIAVANLFVLLTAISAFWLWFVTMPSPTILQLVGLTLYGVLILCLNWLVLRRV